MNSNQSDQDIDETKGPLGPTSEPERSERPQILGHYRVDGELGRGGMGVVYVAYDTRLERRVAIKVLPQAIAGDAKALSHFEQEARILAALDHPNIAMIYSLERAEDVAFITLQLVPGDTLAVRLTDGPLALDEVKQALDDAVAGKGLEKTLSDTLEGALKVGQMAPRFSLANSEGVMTSSETLISMRPLIVHFYRGHW